jgi:hypothetical protein
MESSRLFGPVQVVTTVTIIADREGGRVVSRYDAQGNETDTLRYVSPDTLVEKSVHTYNSNGKRTETVTSKPDGALLTKTLYLYNFQGELSEQTTLDDVGIIDRAIYTHDAKKQAIDETITSARNGATKRLTHFYDAKGQEAATAIVARDGSVSKLTFVYDDKGNMTERVVHTSDGSVLDRLRYEYEFDIVGNWVKQTELICIAAAKPTAFLCTPTAVISRTITYAAQGRTAAEQSTGR